MLSRFGFSSRFSRKRKNQCNFAVKYKFNNKDFVRYFYASDDVSYSHLVELFSHYNKFGLPLQIVKYFKDGTCEIYYEI